MKTTLFIFILTAFITLVNAQSVDYTVVYDHPEKPKASVNIDLAQIDMGVTNLDGTSFNLGAYGYYKPIEKLGIDYNLKISWLALGKLGYKDYPRNLELNLGGSFALKSSLVTRNTKVVLKAKDVYTTTGDYRQITYIMVPATQLHESGVRGGLYFKSGPFNYADYKSEDATSTLAETKLSSVGIYGGVYTSILKNIFIDAKDYGNQYNSIGDDFYFDVMVIPSNTFKDLNKDKENVTSYVKDNKGAMPLGFRLGWRRYQVEKKARTGKKFGLSYMGEAGFKPYQGWFINGGLGITLVK